MSLPWNRVTWYTKLGAVVVVVIAIALGFYFWNKYQEVQELKNTLVVNLPEDSKPEEGIDTFNWQTYRNEDIGFELNFPQEWLNVTLKELDDTVPDRFFGFSNNKEEVAFHIFVGVSPGNKELFDLITNAEVGDVIEKDLILYTKLENAEVDGHLAIRYVSDRTAVPGLFPSILEEKLVEKEGKIFHFFETGRSEEAIMEEREILDSILLTFRFIERETTIDTSTWELYTNPQFGYSLRIPPDFEGVAGDDIQKRFHVHSNTYEPGYTGDFCNTFHCPPDGVWEAVELQILALSHDDPAVGQSAQEAKDSFKRFQELAVGEEIDESGLQAQKAQNIDLDGCMAPQFKVLNRQFFHVTSCTGNNRFISFILEAHRLEDVEKYKPLYDASLASFRFNDFSLDKQ